MVEHLGAIQQVIFHIACPLAYVGFILDVAVHGILKGNAARLVHVVAHGEDARFRVPQVVGVGHQGHNGQGVVSIDEVGARHRVTGHVTILPEGPGPNHGGEVQFEGFPLIEGVLLGGHGTIQGVVHLRALGDSDAGIDRFVMQPRFHRQLRRFGIAHKARAVGRHGRGAVVIKKARQARGAAIGNIGGDQGQDDLIQNFARGVGKAHHVPARPRQLEGGVKLAGGG